MTGKEHALSTQSQTMHGTGAMHSNIRNRDPADKILAVWDDLWWHEGSVAHKALVTCHIEAPHLAPRSPERNTPEHFWEHRCTTLTHKRLISKFELVTKDLADCINSTRFPYALLDFMSP